MLVFFSKIRNLQLFLFKIELNFYQSLFDDFSLRLKSKYFQEDWFQAFRPTNTFNFWIKINFDISIVTKLFNG